MVKDKGVGKVLMSKFRTEWKDAKSNGQRVIIAGMVLNVFGDDVTQGEQEKGWPCEMLRGISRMMSVSA
jgi:hypothetical protein